MLVAIQLRMFSLLARLSKNVKKKSTELHVKPTGITWVEEDVEESI